MSKKIVGVTVGTPISPKALENKLKPVKTVNGVAPDENGNVIVDPGTQGDFGTGTYELDLREFVEVDPTGHAETEQEYDLNGKVDLAELIDAIEAGQSIRVVCKAKYDLVITTRYDMSVELTEAVVNNGSWVLSGIGLNAEYAVDDVFDYNFTRLYVSSDNCKLGFTPASLNSKLSQYVKSVNGEKPDVYGNVTVVGEPGKDGATVEEVLEALPDPGAAAFVKNGNTITATVTMDDGSVSTSVIELENGLPKKVTTDGVECPMTFEGFETEDSGGGSGLTVVELETVLDMVNQTQITGTDAEKLTAAAANGTFTVIRANMMIDGSANQFTSGFTYWNLPGQGEIFITVLQGVTLRLMHPTGASYWVSMVEQ